MPPAPLDLKNYIRDIADFPKPGILFRDITPLLADPHAFRDSIEQFAARYQGDSVDVIVAAETRGFIFAAPLAVQLRAGFVPIRKPGKLPSETIQENYELEYGTDTLCMHGDAVVSGQNVLIVDDLIATGGTVAACCRMVERLGGRIVGCAFLVELSFLKGRDALPGRRIISLVDYESE